MPSIQVELLNTRASDIETNGMARVHVYGFASGRALVSHFQLIEYKPFDELQDPNYIKNVFVLYLFIFLPFLPISTKGMETVDHKTPKRMDFPADICLIKRTNRRYTL